MTGEQLWVLKLLLAHLLTDFVLQPKSWVTHRNLNHFRSSRLYMHGLVTGAVALVLTGIQYWQIAVVITVTHVLIDGWKSYRKDAINYFLLDQFLHLAVIAGCWYIVFFDRTELQHFFRRFAARPHFWVLITGYIMLTNPAGILIGQMTKGWREKINNPESLANAGKWIGIIERSIVFILVLLGQYAAISLLIAAKGIIRFNEKDRPEVKTEYLVIGTLLSIAIAMVTGIVVRKLIAL